MVKLLKYDWKRYRSSLMILLGATVILALLIFMCMAFVITGEDTYALEESNAVSAALLTMLLLMVPYGAYVYTILSYSTDVGRKGMIFLTPSATWKVILSKVLFGIGVYIALQLVCTLLIWLLSQFSQVCESDEVVDAFESMAELFTFYYDQEIPPAGIAYFCIDKIISMLHTVLLVIGSISLARYAANSTAIQVLLTLVFCLLVWIIEILFIVLIGFVIGGEGDMFLFSNSWLALFISFVYTGILYIVSVVLTDSKVNISM